MRKRYPIAVAAALTAALAGVATADAAVVWDGDASGGTAVFDGVECAAPGTVVTAANQAGHGTIFRYTKPAGSIRCETRGVSGVTFAAGNTYWLGWESQLSTVTGDFVVWQWKSYPNSSQNYPLIMTVKNGSVRLFYVAPNTTSWTLLWSGPVSAGAWNRFAIGIRTSASATTGWVELYVNGARVVRHTGRTWDSANEPKWGAYDRDDGSTEVINRIDSLKLGTSYADVS